MVAGSGFENCGRARSVGWRRPTVELEIESATERARFGSITLQLDSLLTVGVPVGVLTAGSPLGSVKYGGSGGSEAQPRKSGEEDAFLKIGRRQGASKSCTSMIGI